jgi:hypothetical protein
MLQLAFRNVLALHSPLVLLMRSGSNTQLGWYGRWRRGGGFTFGFFHSRTASPIAPVVSGLSLSAFLFLSLSLSFCLVVSLLFVFQIDIRPCVRSLVEIHPDSK